ncbi:MAG: pyruvate dehydrogenase (acetyl-transferring) E1 component subunit alpha [Alphaproteobacteria bacterium]|nr:pyruvate dehydrogenase (acetyl-transferring) E1 component subunit alpha [Alphaproteobacteria bacterium]
MADAAPDVDFTLRRAIGPDGEVVGPLPDVASDREAVTALYRAMVLTRSFDEKAIALQRTGRLGTYASSLGQEAVSVGVAAAMAAEDVLLPSFREHGAQLQRGATPVELFQFWGGDERGNDFKGPRGDFPVCIPVSSQLPHAAGVALAMRLDGGGRAAVAVCGDGGASKGDFYEAINLAGVWELPLVTVICNNRWAISTPLARQTAAGTLAHKALAAGIDARRVDGNDVLAVRAVAAECLERARADSRPALIEAVTYRLGDHTTVDDATRYRDEAEVKEHWPQEPIARLRAYLVAQDWWAKEDETRLLKESAEEIAAASETYLALDPEPPTAMFDHLYETLPPALAAQRAALAGGTGGDG